MNHKLNDAMSHISDAFIADAAVQVNKARGAVVPPRPRPWLGAVAAVLVIALIGALMFPVLNALDRSGGSNPTSAPIMQQVTTTGQPTTRPTTSPSTDIPPAISTPTTVPSTAPTTRPATAPSTGPTTWPITAPTTIPAPDGVGDPCGKGHRFSNGFCVYCAARDPDYDPCANGHRFIDGYCAWCLAADPNFSRPTTVPSTGPTTRPTTNPGTASLTTDKSVYLVNETIRFTISPVSKNNKLTLERVDGNWSKSYSNISSSFSLAFGWAGEYKATFTVSGIADSAIIYFTVIEADSGNAPTYATITADKGVYKLGDTVHFFMSSDGDLNTLWIYAPDGSYVYFNDAGNAYSYTPKMAGQYRAMIEASNGTALLASDKIVFQVVDPNYSCTKGHTYMNGSCIYCAHKDPNYTPCMAGEHTFENGFCINCSTADPDYFPCADGHTFENGYCVWCLKEDPDYDFCANGHNYRNGTCLRCGKEDPDYNPCAYGHSFSNGACIRCGAAAPTHDGTSTLEQEYGATLKILIPGHNTKDPTTWQNKVIENFKTNYPNVTVQFVIATWNDWYEKLMAAYSSGDPIDLIYDSVKTEPKFAISGITQPLQSYINMDNPNLKMTAMEECFQYSGNYYVAATEVNYGVIFYNKDMFEAAGLDDPMELYRKGEWNWTTFVRLAKLMTNKSTDTYGFATEFPYLFYGANATSTLKLDAQGRYSLNMDDPAFIAALNIIQDGEYTSGWSGWEGTAMGSFERGKAAMLGSFSMYESEINQLNALLGWDPINYGVVPLPAGPNNPQHLNMIQAYGWAIGADSDCPAHVGKLIDMLVDGQAAYLAQQNAQLPAASVELYQEMSKKVFCVNTRDSAIDGDDGLIWQVVYGKPVAQAIEEYKPQYQAMIKPYASDTQNG